MKAPFMQRAYFAPDSYSYFKLATTTTSPQQQRQFDMHIPTDKKTLDNAGQLNNDSWTVYTKPNF